MLNLIQDAIVRQIEECTEHPYAMVFVIFLAAAAAIIASQNPHRVLPTEDE